MQSTRIQPVVKCRVAKKSNVTKRRKVKFNLNVPGAQKVHLMGDFNLWNPEVNQMRKNEKGVWQTTVTLSPGRYEYRFRVDGEWYNDPNNTTKCPNCFGSENSVIQVMS